MPLASPSALSHVARRIGSHAWALLLFTTLIWGANAVAARLAVNEIPPMVLTASRWVICCVALWATSRQQIAQHWRSLVPSWRVIVAMGALGFTGFNALFYAAAYHTTAINIAIIQGTIPILVLIGSFLFFGTRVGPLQALGVLMTLGGIAVVASRGDLSVLAQLAFNIGDVWMVVACILYTGYTLALRNRPAVPAIVFFAAMALVAFVSSLPLVVLEAVRGGFYLPSAKGVAIALFVGLLPSFVSQITFMRAIELIGPARAGVFLNLVPIFGPLLAMLVLREPLMPYHLLALLLVLGGIAVAEYFGVRGSGRAVVSRSPDTTESP